MKELSMIIKTVDTAVAAVKIMNIAKKTAIISVAAVCGFYCLKKCGKGFRI